MGPPSPDAVRKQPHRAPRGRFRGVCRMGGDNLGENSYRLIWICSQAIDSRHSRAAGTFSFVKIGSAAPMVASTTPLGGRQDGPTVRRLGVTGLLCAPGKTPFDVPPRTTNIWDMSPAAVLAVGGPSMRDRRRTTHAAHPSRPRGRRASQATRPQAVARHSATSTGWVQDEKSPPNRALPAPPPPKSVILHASTLRALFLRKS